MSIIQTFLELKWYQKVPAVVFTIIVVIPALIILSPIIFLTYCLYCFEWVCSGEKPDWSD